MPTATPTPTLEFDVQNNVATVMCFGPIGRGEGMVNAKAFVDQLQLAGDVGEIAVHINSPGGSAFEAFAIYNALVQHKAKVTTIGEGAVLSAASIILQAGDTRKMAANALLMIHGPMVGTKGGIADHERQIEMLKRLQGSIIEAYAARTGVEKPLLAKMLETDTWMTADEAKELNFVDEVIPAKTAENYLAADDLSKAPPHIRDAALCQEIFSPDEEPDAPVNEPQETHMSKETVTEPQAVTLVELKSTFPDSTADWRESQLEKGVTLQAASVAYAAFVKAQADAEKAELQKQLDEAKAEANTVKHKTKGHDPVTVEGQLEYAGDTGDAVLDFDAAVCKLAGDNPSLSQRQAAIRTVAKRQPELYAAFLNDTNPGKRQARLIEEKLEDAGK